MGALKNIGIVAWCAGIAACIGLTVWTGVDDVGSAIARAGWGMPFVILTRTATVSIAGVGWWLLFPGSWVPGSWVPGSGRSVPADGRLFPENRPLQLRAAVLLRFIREAVNTLLPLTQVGGDIIGARLVAFRAASGPLAAASVIIDVLMQAATQFLFALLGLVTLVVLGIDRTVVGIAATGLALALPALGGFYLVQRGSGRRAVHFVLSRLSGDRNWRLLGTVDRVYQGLSTIYARRSGLAVSGVVHLTGWLVGVCEVYIVLYCLGQDVTIAEALVIESLIQAVRGAAFAIPSALGAQEAGLILLCGIFQIPPDQALVLSLSKRAADLVIGVPGLLALQTLEGERLTASFFRRERPKRTTLDLQSAE
jgi:putative membrane protein